MSRRATPPAHLAPAAIPRRELGQDLRFQPRLRGGSDVTGSGFLSLATRLLVDGVANTMTLSNDRTLEDARILARDEAQHRVSPVTRVR